MRSTTFYSALIATTVVASVGVLAQSNNKQETRDWTEMRKEAISADTLLSGDVKNNFNPVGSTRDLILNEAGDQIEYVLFEVPYPYSFYTGEDGFVNYDSVDVEHGITGEVNLVIEDADVGLPADQLTLTRSEADDRMVSRLLGSEIEFSGGDQRQVQDILVDPESGEVSHFVVEMNPEALFEDEPRTVRADKISISEEGSLRADLSLDEVEENQDYDTGLL